MKANIDPIRLFLVLTFTYPIFISGQILDSTVSAFSNSTSNCEFYENQKTWLPNAFLINAKCVCSSAPNSISANTVRYVLQQELKAISDSIKSIATEKKNAYLSKRISKKKYNQFVKNTLAKPIAIAHEKAYNAAFCKRKKQKLWRWKKISTKEVKNCNLTWFAVRYFGGNCHKKWGRW